MEHQTIQHQTIQQQLDYWKRLLPVGSVWLTQKLSCKFVTIKSLSYDRATGYLMVQYTGEETPNAVFEEIVGAFYNHIVDYQVQ